MYMVKDEIIVNSKLDIENKRENHNVYPSIQGKD